MAAFEAISTASIADRRVTQAGACSWMTPSLSDNHGSGSSPAPSAEHPEEWVEQGGRLLVGVIHLQAPVGWFPART